MEFSPEIAVLQSALIFASKKVGTELSQITAEAEMKSFTDLIAPTIKDIIEGLEEERSDLDKNIWSLKIVSFLLSHILKERLKETTNQTREEFNGDRSNPTSEEMTRNTYRKYCKGEEIFQHIPCLSFPVFIEIVTRLKLTDYLLECIAVLDNSTAVNILRDIMSIVEESSFSFHQLSLVLSCFKYVVWNVCKSSKHQLEFEDGFHILCCTITTWLSKHFHFDMKSSDESFQMQRDFRNIVVLLSHVFLSDNVGPAFKSLITKSQINSDNHPPERLATTIFQELQGKGKQADSDESFVFFVKSLQKTCSKTEWLTIVTGIMPGCDMHCEDNTTADSLFQGGITHPRESTLDLGLTSLDMDIFYKSLLKLLDSQFHDLLHADKGVETLMKFIQMSAERISNIRALKQKEENERKGQITMQEKLSKRLPGYEDCLDEMISCCDLTTWKSERYAELLGGNTGLLYKEQHVERLHQTLRQMLRTGDSWDNADSTLEAILDILLKTFSKLPILTQEKIILDNFLEKDMSDLLSHIGNFNQQMNITFNQSTSDTSGKQLDAVLRLCLMNPVSVVQRAVSAVVKSPGQTGIIIKIFQSVPDLCRCCYGNHHPERSLLCHVTCQYLLENILSHNEEKNVIKFVSMATQSFTREVCGYQLQEAAILSPGEFSSSSILPFIGLQSENQPISTEFALKLFIALLEKKRDTDSDWLESLQLQTFLLCLCELLHDCVASWDTDGHMTTKYGVKQLCLRCLSLLQTNCTGLFSKAHVEAIDWLKSRTKELDWSVLILLEKTLAKLSDIEESRFTNLVETLAQHLTKQIGTNCLPLLRFVSISDETLQAAMRQVESTKRVISPESITCALVELLPHLLLAEWRRVVSLLLCLIDFDKLSINYRLMFCNIIPLSANYDVKCVLSLTQLLTSVVIVTACSTSAPSAVVHHVATCYTAVLQEQIKLSSTLKDKKTEAFLIGQMFSHVTIAMTTLEDDQSETLFVLLLKLLEKFTDLQSTRSLKGKKPTSSNKNESEESIFKAVTMVTDVNRQETLLKKLLEQEKLK